MNTKSLQYREKAPQLSPTLSRLIKSVLVKQATEALENRFHVMLRNSYLVFIADDIRESPNRKLLSNTSML